MPDEHVGSVFSFYHLLWLSCDETFVKIYFQVFFGNMVASFCVQYIQYASLERPIGLLENTRSHAKIRKSTWKLHGSIRSASRNLLSSLLEQTSSHTLSQTISAQQRPVTFHPLHYWIYSYLDKRSGQSNQGTSASNPNDIHDSKGEQRQPGSERLPVLRQWVHKNNNNNNNKKNTPDHKPESTAERSR